MKFERQKEVSNVLLDNFLLWSTEANLEDVDFPCTILTITPKIQESWGDEYFNIFDALNIIRY